MSLPYYIVFGGYLAFLVWTCLKSMKQVETLSDFTTGGHRMGLFLGIGTTVATWVSVASVMGVPGFLYRTGAAAIIGWVAGWFLATALDADPGEPGPPARAARTHLPRVHPHAVRALRACQLPATAGRLADVHRLFRLLPPASRGLRDRLQHDHRCAL